MTVGGLEHENQHQASSAPHRKCQVRESINTSIRNSLGRRHSSAGIKFLARSPRGCKRPRDSGGYPVRHRAIGESCFASFIPLTSSPAGAAVDERNDIVVFVLPQAVRLDGTGSYLSSHEADLTIEASRIRVHRF